MNDQLTCSSLRLPGNADDWLDAADETNEAAVDEGTVDDSAVNESAVEETTEEGVTEETAVDEGNVGEGALLLLPPPPPHAVNKHIANKPATLKPVKDKHTDLLQKPISLLPSHLLLVWYNAITARTQSQ
ncbi:hypothetical protein [Cellvibrio sp. pealriver]|uniref:hypothetical protein n=1 Tax=Cellvibrio sp. pealriver TaxID=1622269 RepID=UPI00066FF4C7|nr:hypothetical protein [Cellvibrio sp. pealriver]